MNAITGLKLFRYAKCCGQKHVLQASPLKIAREELFNLKYVPAGDLTNFIHKETGMPQKLIKRFSQEEIRKAYNEYCRSPYINDYLRENMKLSEASENLVTMLRQGINDSEPITGSFARGIRPSKRVGKLETEDDIAKYIFNNKGFTSTAPIEKMSQSAVIDKDGAMIIFDINTPIKGYKPDPYEVLFDINAFTSDKYEIFKIRDGLFKVTEKGVGKAALYPDIVEGSAVPRHGDLCGANMHFRDLLKDIEKADFDKEDYCKSLLKMMYETDCSFNKIPPTKSFCVGYCGRVKTNLPRFNADFKVLEDAKVGDVIVPDTAYSYYAFEPEVAIGGFTSETKQSLFIKAIFGPESRLSRNRVHGGEIVTPRGAEYKLLKKEIDKDGNIYATIEYQLPRERKSAETERIIKFMGYDDLLQ